MKARALLSILVPALAVLAPVARASEPFPPATAQKNKVKVELAADVTAAAPGETLRLGVFLRPDPEWHVYWKFAGDTGLPTQIHWTAPDGVDFDGLAWPLPHRIPDKLGGRSFGYDGEVLLTSLVRVPADVLEGTVLPVEAKVEWLVCKENCIQGSATVGLELPVRSGPAAERASSSAAAFDRWAAKVPVALPEHVKMTSKVADAPLAPGSALTIELLLTADRPLAAKTPLVEAFFPATEGLEITTVDARQIDPNTLALTLTGKTAEDGELVSRLDGVVQLVLDGTPGAFDVRVEVPRKAGVPLAKGPIVEAKSGSPTLLPGRPAASGADPCAESGTGSDGGGMATSFLLALAFAFLGGLILNAMPCVLPVLSLKVMGVVEQSKEEPKVIWRHGLAYFAGVEVSFLVFAIVLAALHETWAFQFRDPMFVAIFTAIIFAFGLSLFGVFEIALPGAGRLDAAVAGSHGYMSSFNYGIFAVLLGTPCTAPFLSPALAYAATQPPFEMAVLLLAVGAGLAFPFLVIARFPQWRRLLPKPGPWLTTFKQVMGFLLVGTAVFMLSILSEQVSRAAFVGYLVFLSVLSLALWVYGHWTGPTRGTRARLIGSAVAVGLTVFGAMTFVSSEPPEPTPGTRVIDGITWHDFDTIDVEAKAAEGELVFIDFTASWCTTCKVNEATAIHTDSSSALFAKLGVLAVKADYTLKNDKISAWLQRFDEPSVPLYVVIPPGRPAEAFKLTPLISEDDVRDGVCRAKKLVTSASL